uniref:Uncharacterized protein n=1 Tax=Plectus sambesii TaxID=2011161 RepID=A0A914WSR8_9BILA
MPDNSSDNEGLAGQMPPDRCDGGIVWYGAMGGPVKEEDLALSTARWPTNFVPMDDGRSGRSRSVAALIVCLCPGKLSPLSGLSAPAFVRALYESPSVDASGDRFDTDHRA